MKGTRVVAMDMRFSGILCSIVVECVLLKNVATFEVTQMKYALISRIGQGAYGVVLKARAVEVCFA